MKKLFRIAIYFIVLNLLFGNSQIKETKIFKLKENPRIFEQLLSEDYSKWKKGKNNVSPNLVSEKRGRRVLGSAYSLSAITKYGNLTKKGIKVRFYGEEDVDTSGLTEAQLRKLKADGIATTGDGYIWINKEKIKDGNTINFNKVVSHEITHQILGEDSEYEARYVESGMEEFLSEIKENGYLKDGKIIDLLYSRLTDEDRARLNRYILEDMQFKDLSGGAGDRYTVVNLKYQKMSEYMRNASLNEKYSNAGKGLEEYKKHLKENIAKYRKDKLKGKKLEEEVNALTELEYKTRNRRIREEQTEARKRGLIQKEDRLFKVLGDKDAETALKYFHLDVNQRDNVVTSVDEQKEAYKEKYGRYPKDEYVNDKITFFTRNPELKGTRIVTEIPLEVMIKLMQTEIYPDRSMRVYPNPNNNETLWNFVNSEAYTNKGIREYTMLYKDSKTGRNIEYKFKVLDKRETASGLQAVTLWDAKTKETIVVAQGSNPGIEYPIKAPVASYGKVALGEAVNNVVRGTFQAVPFPFNNMLTPVRDKMIADNNSRIQTAKNDIKNYQINMKNWQNDWIENNLKGNVNVGIWDGIKKNDVPITRIAKGIKNIVSIAKGEKTLFTPNQSIETEQYIREINSGKIIDNAKYGKVSIGLGHSLEGQGITYGTDRTNTNSIAIDPAPNNLKIKNQRSHLTLLSDSAILNKSEIRNGTRQHYTSFYGVTTSVGLGTVRVGMGVGATGVPVYQSKYHYTGNPIPKDEKERDEVINDGHKMSEHFDQMRQEIEMIDKLLVRPEGWDK